MGDIRKPKTRNLCGCGVRDHRKTFSLWFMVTFPNAKINLGLSVLRKREDGFHDIATVFYPIELCDVLEVIEGGAKPFSLDQSGLAVAGNPEENLCYKAWKMLAADFKLPNLQGHLHKVIPMGAGLGGGSADGAFMLKLINEVCKIGLDDDALIRYAARLGSDCPFFIRNKPVYATGRGEIMEEFPDVLSGYQVTVRKPDILVSTAEAYSWISPKEPNDDIREILKLNPSEWRGSLVNDFEAPVCARHPDVRALIDQLYNEGALYAAMSGSGAAVFGVFEKVVDIEINNVFYR
jgi:4-diphosphocytidyl-2-C-methyl-D-erythritol kinase